MLGMEKTVFQKIIDRELPATIEYEDEKVIAFRDIHPSAPVHVLIVPKKLIGSLSSADEVDESVLGHIQLVAYKLAEKLQISKAFKLVVNGGSLQEVPHIHYHLLGGF